MDIELFMSDKDKVKNYLTINGESIPLKKVTDIIIEVSTRSSEFIKYSLYSNGGEGKR